MKTPRSFIKQLHLSSLKLTKKSDLSLTVSSDSCPITAIRCFKENGSSWNVEPRTSMSYINSSRKLELYEDSVANSEDSVMFSV